LVESSIILVKFVVIYYIFFLILIFNKNNRIKQMNTLCDEYIREFSGRLIRDFCIEASVNKLMEMWKSVVADGRASVVFSDSVSRLPQEKIKQNGKSCTKLLASGINKGTECGKKCVGESSFCTKHAGKQLEPVAETCSYLMVSGAKKGTACGKKCHDDSDMCSVHLKIKTKSVVDSEPPTTYKVTFKQRENGLLVAMNATPSGSIFVFNNTKDRLISGKLGPDDRVIPLDEDDVGFCRDNNLKIVHPISSKIAIEDLLDEIQHQ